MMDEMHQALLTHKKARLIEDKMSYEDLAVMGNFDDDELTYALNRQMLKERKDTAALRKAKKLEQQFKDLRRISLDGMQAIVETITAIDENSKKIVFKHFDQQDVNVL